MNYRNKNNELGFTLLEVMLSVALLTTIVMLTINVLSNQIAIRQKVIDRYPFDKVMNRITQDISGAYIQPTNPLDKKINFVNSSSGDDSSLIFTVINYDSLIYNSKESNLAQIGYVVETKDNQKQLIRIVDAKMEEGRNIPSEGVGVRNVLVADIKEISLEFWKKTEFVETWDSTTNESGKLPNMVKIKLTIYTPKGKYSKEKSELHLETIVYIRNSTLKAASADEQDTEEHKLQ